MYIYLWKQKNNIWAGERHLLQYVPSQDRSACTFTVWSIFVGYLVVAKDPKCLQVDSADSDFDQIAQADMNLCFSVGNAVPYLIFLLICNWDNKNTLKSE